MVGEGVDADATYCMKFSSSRLLALMAGAAPAICFLPPVAAQTPTNMVERTPMESCGQRERAHVSLLARSRRRGIISFPGVWGAARRGVNVQSASRSSGRQSCSIEPYRRRCGGWAVDGREFGGSNGCSEELFRQSCHLTLKWNLERAHDIPYIITLFLRSIVIPTCRTSLAIYTSYTAILCHRVILRSIG